MFDTQDEKDMILSLHTRKPVHHLKTRTPSQQEKHRSLPINNSNVDKHFSKLVPPEYDSLRDGAINRSIVGSDFHKKSNLSSKSESRESRQSKLAPGHICGEVFAGRAGPRVAEEGGMKKRGRVKKGVLKREESFSEKDKLNHLQQRRELLNGYNGDAIRKDESPGKKKKQFNNMARDSSSLSDYTSASDREKTDTLKRLTSANRPKSAGQARYLTERFSDSDDSFYDGEIEEVDLDDPVFAFEREFEEARAARLAKQRHVPTDNKTMEVCVESHSLISHMNASAYKHEQTRHASKMRPQSDRNLDMTSEGRPPTSHRKRRVQSETEVGRISLIPRRVQNFKPKKETHKDKRLSEPFVSEKLYTYSMDKVISKYSGLSVKRSGASYPSQKVGQDSQSAQRAPFPRKLKPILRREKLGHNLSSPEQEKIDCEW